MSRELMKTIGVSLTSSLCTALFVVACTAGAEKMSHDDRGSDDGAEDDGEDDDGSGGNDDDGGDGPGDDGDDGDGVSAADLAELAAQLDDLVAFQASALCFIGHMTDEQQWDPGWDWSDIGADDAVSWEQGPNSDASKAYDDCF